MQEVYLVDHSLRRYPQRGTVQKDETDGQVLHFVLPR
jgi:hypothetical protein